MARGKCICCDGAVPGHEGHVVSSVHYEGMSEFDRLAIAAMPAAGTPTPGEVCLSCNAGSGNDWSQCKDGPCPVPMSPHYSPLFRARMIAAAKAIDANPPTHRWDFETASAVKLDASGKDERVPDPGEVPPDDTFWSSRERIPMVEVAKADPLGPTVAIPMCIVARRDVTETRARRGPAFALDKSTLEGSRAFFADQADRIFSAMVDSLPRGTIDALLVKLLDHRRSILVISGAAIASAVPEKG